MAGGKFPLVSKMVKSVTIRAQRALLIVSRPMATRRRGNDLSNREQTLALKRLGKKRCSIEALYNVLESHEKVSFSGWC